MKVAIAILSDPKPATEEGLGRVFNALAAAYDFKAKAHDVEIYFLGAGTRWAGVLSQPDHPAYELYQSVADTVAGVSCGCADVFGAREEAERNGFDLITDSPVPGTSGLPSVAKLIADGFQVITF